MDALAIQESTNLDYASSNDGVMHACGHDGHTTILLGAARYLAENRDFCGTVRFIFQPAEEGLGGAKVMIDEGLFEKFPCDAVYAMHAVPGLETGHFAIRPGPFLASSDTWSVVFKGTGGHGAIRHKAIDPFLPAGAFISALQSIVSTNVPSEELAVLSIGHIHGGEYDAPNVIPDQITLRGTARCFMPDVRDLLEKGTTRLAKSTAAAFSCEADVDYLRRYPPLINSTEQTRIAIQAAVKVAGTGNVDPDSPRVSGAEDFAYMLEKVPGAYINLGCGDGPFVHTPNYDFNDNVIVTGAAYWANLAAIELSEP
jgi:hippurate hydrolase